MTRTSWCGQVAAPKASLRLGPLAQRRSETVRAADDKACRRTVFGTPFAQACAASAALSRLFAALVEDGDDRAFGNDVGDGDRFFDAAALGILRAAFADFDDLDVANAEPPPDGFGALAIGGGKFAFRTLFETADGGNR